MLAPQPNDASSSFQKVNGTELWYIEKRSDGTKISLNINQLFLHLISAPRVKEEIQRPILYVKNKSSRQIDNIRIYITSFIESGATKKCYNLLKPNWVCLKIREKDFSMFPTFRREVAIQKFLARNHPSFCPLYFAFLLPSRKKPQSLKLFYIAKKFDQELGKCKFDTTALHRIFIIVSKAIKFAHHHNIILCDIKDENILVSYKEKRIAITDLQGAYRVSDPLLELRFTVMSPDMLFAVLGAHPPGFSHDVFSWGVIMHDLFYKKNSENLFKKLPDYVALAGESPTREKVVNVYRNMISNFRRQLPQDLFRPILVSMTQYDPGFRISIDEVIKGLERINLTKP